MNTWNIGLASWIIQDGNYGDFSRDQEVEFAVEFCPQEFQVTSWRSKTASLLAESTYRVTAEIVFVASRVWVIDFGLLAYEGTQPPEGIEQGHWIEATVYLGVDPFSYFEQLAAVSGIPPLICWWHINRIQLETAPFIESSEDPKVRVRDKSKSALRDIEQTDAWKDDAGNAEYVLNCELLERQPTYQRSFHL